MKIVELILDEQAFENGVEAISIVESPAIKTDFVALSEQNKWKFTNQDAERQILIGPALIPNQTIYRNQGGEEFYIFFSAETIRKVSERFFARGNQNNATIEHSVSIEGTTIVESWLVDDPEKDKSAIYNFKVPKGTWMVSMKVWDRSIWDEYVKTGDVKGFSVEGYFADKVRMSKTNLEEGVAHYKEDGTLYIGPTHKDPEGRLMTGAEHTEDSEYLYHKEDLERQENENESNLALAILQTLTKLNV